MNFSASSSNYVPSTELASLYECPVCYEYISPPLLQCSNGHMVCSSCRPKLNCCPSCKAPLGTSRNLLMEKALSHVNFPCKFSDQGCQVTMLLRYKSAHEGKCALRPAFSCFYCKWEGAIGHVFSHFLNHHPWIKITQGDDITLRVGADEISKSGVCRWSRLQNCFGGHHFLFILKKGKEYSHHPIRFIVAVQLIGTRNQAKNFSYRLTLSGHRHTLIWEGTPLSIQDNLDYAAENHECLDFESADVRGQLFSQDGSLNIHVKIERKEFF